MANIKDMHSDYFKLLYFSISAEMTGVKDEERYIELLELLKLDWYYFYPISEYFLHMASMPIRYGLTEKAVDTLIKSSIEVERIFNSVESSMTPMSYSKTGIKDLELVVYDYIVSCREIVSEMNEEGSSGGLGVSLKVVDRIMREVVWN